MLLCLEGPTASGKSTLMKKMCEDVKFQRADEHTPPPCKEGADLLERQEMVFKSFMDHCENLRQSEKTIIADFSPLGVVAFSAALGRWKQDERFSEQAARFKKLCDEKDWTVIAYLNPGADAIKQRLKGRARPGDDAWDPHFLEILCEEYDHYFSDVKISEEYSELICKLRQEIDREKKQS